MGKYIIGFVMGWIVGLATGYMNNVLMAKKLKKDKREYNDKKKHDPC